MTIGIVVAVRNSRAEEIIAALDAAATDGQLHIYKGTRPATGAAPGGGDLLATLDLSDPCGTVSAGVLTFSAIESSNGLASGLPTWGRFSDGDGNAKLDGDVGIANELIVMDEDPDNLGYPVEIYEGGLVAVTSASLTEGNA